MKYKNNFIFLILGLIAMLYGIGTRQLIDGMQYGAVYHKEQQYFNGLALVHYPEVVVQQQGMDLKIRDAILMDSMGYTPSMQPTMYGGNKPIVRPYKYYGIKQEGICPDLTQGEIIVFKNPDNFWFDNSQPMIIHRIVDMFAQPGYVKTKGDNNLVGEYVPCDYIKYKVIGIIYK